MSKILLLLLALSGCVTDGNAYTKAELDYWIGVANLHTEAYQRCMVALIECGSRKTDAGLTDLWLNSKVLSAADALRLAAWIIETFGEEKP
jgi:hypothetical protein